ncbi:MAG: hypothetical protein JST62_05970 [Bacteroidetes bacterium]|nr:hypothetical protein [Bacteroidota bacterium]
MKTNSLHKISKILLAICGIGLIVSIFTPIWAIFLEAPQYPEGLSMYIYSNKLGGEFDIINGLNHYIGMKHIKEDEFIEFKILPYALGVLGAICLLVAAFGKKVWLYTFTILYLVFGVAFMYDFWQWEYDYGHNLDPNAAIVVPGMSYQPPLIGSKQLLNFTAHSYPDIGGWIMIGAAFILIALSILEFKKTKKI